eukprot:CAMPEP_0117792976 /NCGR_PEP_ID=MMETSP0948-20121206/9763_1 /TAXON_ID=44440 /ORGANISM="Chattonella subsalsa, Strain CCMP2191" /LENGTH=39 /DNA_ID= /DNA_START= /DNA_END= /DNA_ORIENTATION=
MSTSRARFPTRFDPAASSPTSAAIISRTNASRIPLSNSI